MSPIAMLAAAALCGVSYGWEPIGGGGYEYIIQIEPHKLEAFANSGEEGFTSELPPHSDVRRIRLIVSNAPLPHQGEPLPRANPAATAPPATNSTWPGFPALPSSTFNSTTPMLPDNGGYPGISLPTPPTAENDRPTIRRNSGRAATADDDEVLAPRPAPAAANSTTASNSGGSKTAESRQLLSPLTLLFLSIGANFYLGWIVFSQRERYRMLVEQRTGFGVLT